MKTLFNVAIVLNVNKPYVIAYRLAATVAYERSIGFTIPIMTK